MAHDDRHLAGIGGWLAFFWISITFLGPLSLIASMSGQLYGDETVAAAFGDKWPMVQAGEWFLAALSVAGMWFLSWRLMKVETWKTVKIVIAGLWIIGMGGPLLEVLLIGATGLVDAGTLGKTLGEELVRPLIASTIWTAYFLRSRRVRNTYPRESDREEMAEIFS
jgi:hypothetical protein